jgi:hypothetical protein
VSAHKPLIVPMQLRISQLQLRGIGVLVVDRTKGITLCFKDDPLQSVQVNSTFDDLASVKGMLQMEIEKQLRDLFTEQLPSLVHQLSLRKMGLQEHEWEQVLRRSTDNVSSGAEQASVDSGLGSSIQTVDNHNNNDDNVAYTNADGDRLPTSKPFRQHFSMPMLAKTIGRPLHGLGSSAKQQQTLWETRSAMLFSNAQQSTALHSPRPLHTRRRVRSQSLTINIPLNNE